MGVSAEQGPKVIYGQRPTIGAAGSNNPDCGPSTVWGGWGLIDGRVGYNVTRMGDIQLYGTDKVCVVDQVPSTLSTTAIAAAQVPVTTVPLTLVAASGAGITVLAAATTIWASGNVIPAGSLAIDGAPGLVQIGQLAQLSTGVTRQNAYDPTKAISRALTITSAGDDHLASITITGADVYGYPQSQTLTMGNTAAVTTTKTFKFIYSAVATGTLSGSNVSIGQADVYGFGIYCPKFAYSEIYWNSARITANTGFVAGDATSPATASTGDVRGTYAVQSASDGTKSLQVFITPAVANTLTNIGLFGQIPV